MKPASAALLLCLLAPATTSAQSQTTPVVSSIADDAAAIAPALQIRSDGRGGYVNKPRYLDSYIDNAVGDWELDLGIVPTKGSGRTAYLAFDQPIPGSGSNGGNAVAPPSQRYIVRLVGRCFTEGKNLLVMAHGQQFTCPLWIAFNDYNGNQFRIYMNGTAHAATEDVQITCSSVGTDARCNRWVLTPTGLTLGGDGGANTGRLVKRLVQKGKTIDVLQGDFKFAFSFELAR